MNSCIDFSRDLFFDCGEVKFSERKQNALSHVLHPIFGLAWTNGTNVFVSRLSDGHSHESTNSSKLIHSSEDVSLCQWACQETGSVNHATFLVVATGSGIVSFWKIDSLEEKFASKIINSFQLEHDVIDMIQLTGLGYTAFIGKNAVSVIRNDEDDLSGKRSCCIKLVEINQNFKCYGWDESRNRLILATSHGSFVAQQILVKNNQLETNMFETNQHQGSIRSLFIINGVVLYADETSAVVTAKRIGEEKDYFIVPNISMHECNDEELIRPNQDRGKSVFESILNLSRVSDATSPLSSSLKLVQFKEDSSTLVVNEMSSSSLDGILFPDLLHACEVDKTSYLILAGSTRSSFLKVFACSKDFCHVEHVDTINFQGKKVKGVTLMHNGDLICLVTETSCDKMGGVFLLKNSSEEVHLRLVKVDKYLQKFSKIIKSRKTCLEAVCEVARGSTESVGACNGHSDDEMNLTIPGKETSRNVLIEVTSPLSSFTCIHCGEPNPLPLHLLSGFHGSMANPDGESIEDEKLRRVVTEAVKSELMKFKAEFFEKFQTELLVKFKDLITNK